MLQRLTTFILIIFCFSACKKESTVCKDENAVNFNMEDQDGGATCVFAIDINEHLFGKWKVMYQLVYKLPSNTTLDALISDYSALTYVEFEDLYEEDYPLSEIEWAEFITGELGYTYSEFETPENSSMFMEIEYTTDYKVKYYNNFDYNESLTHNWLQFDYDHLAYYTNNYTASEEMDIVELQILDQNDFHYRRVEKQGNEKFYEYRRCVKNY